MIYEDLLLRGWSRNTKGQKEKGLLYMDGPKYEKPHKSNKRHNYLESCRAIYDVINNLLKNRWKRWTILPLKSM